MRTTVSHALRAAFLIAGASHPLTNAQNARLGSLATKRARNAKTSANRVRQGKSGLSRASVPRPTAKTAQWEDSRSLEALLCVVAAQDVRAESGHIFRASAIQMTTASSAHGANFRMSQGLPLQTVASIALLGAHRSAPEQVLLTSARDAQQESLWTLPSQMNAFPARKGTRSHWRQASSATCAPLRNLPNAMAAKYAKIAEQELSS